VQELSIELFHAGRNFLFLLSGGPYPLLSICTNICNTSVAYYLVINSELNNYPMIVLEYTQKAKIKRN